MNAERRRWGGPHLHALLREGSEGVDDEAGSGAVEDEHAGGGHPGLQIVHRHRDVLGVGLVEDPDLAVGGRPRHAMAVVMKQDSFVLQAHPLPVIS